MILHVRFEGRSYDLSDNALGLQPSDCDQRIKERVAQHLEVGVERLRLYAVDRQPSGNIVVRPEAVYG